MSTWSKKTYEAVAKILGTNGAPNSIIEDFEDLFVEDNPRFSPKRFADLLIKERDK
jgi:hypothetical protein